MLALPHTFGRYVLTGLIGEGGMAEVYRASVRVAEGLSKWVVIKKIRPEFATRREFTRMFVDEAKIALGLNHANIVQVFDFGQIGDDFYLAMELIEGLDLMRLFHAVRAQSTAFPDVIAAYIGHQVASGLSYAHRRVDEHGEAFGIVHRDVSPHNIMLSFDGGVKLLDFGIARARPNVPIRATAPIEEETIKGKVAYMSPEQAAGRAVDARSDVYSLGVVLFELLTGELVFRGRDRIAALERVRSEPLPPVLDVAPELPYELAAIVDRALARRAEDRFPSSRDLQAALAKFLHRADPMVDDEVMTQFVAQYRAEPSLPVKRMTDEFEVEETRELSGSHSAVASQPRRRSQTALLAYLAFDWADADPRGVGARRVHDFVRDLAFKREALIHQADQRGVLLAFGTVLSNKDDAERGLRLARALRESLGEFAPHVGLGILLAATQVGIDRDADGVEALELPDGLADHMHAVARRVSNESVLVTADVAARLGARWRFGPVATGRPTIPNTHAGEPWAADLQQLAPFKGALSEAERRLHAARGPRALLGRELELKRLRDAFALAIRSRESGALIVVGDPGFGKRALLARFVSSLPAGSCAVLRGSGSWARRNQPLGTFLGMIQEYLGVTSETPKRELVVLLREYGIDEARQLADAFAASLGLPGAEDVRLEPLERRDRLERLVRRLIRSVAQERPVLIVIEDLHFVDVPSVEMLEHFVRRPMPLPVMGLASSRPGPRVTEFRAGLAAQEADGALSVVELSELDEHARRELIVHRFEDPQEADAIADKILARTGGNPLFIEQMIDSLLRGGTIGWNAQARYLVVHDQNANIEVPPSMEDALRDTVENLSPDHRELLQSAAILGSEFRAGELSDLVATPVETALENLVAAGLLARMDADDGLRFSTLSLHQVCKTGLPDAFARERHERAAKIKRDRPDYVEGRDDGPIAEHLIAANRGAEAIDFALRAATAARDVAGNVAAYFHLTQAVQCIPRGDPRRFEALSERAQILRAWGRRRAQGADIRQLIEEASYSDDPEPEVIASMRLLRFYLECGRLHRAIRLAPRLERRIQALAEREPFLAVLGELKSETAFLRGNFDEAEALARGALPHCWDDERGVRQRFRLLSSVGKVQLGTGRHAEAEATFREALELARAIGNRRLEAEARTRLGEATGRMARYQEAVEHFQVALAIDRDLGDRYATGVKLANIGIAYTAIGLYRRAERYLRKALELHEAIGHPQLLNDVMVNLGEVVSELGDPESACDLLVDAANTARERNDARIELRAEVYRARALWMIGTAESVQEARAVAESVVERGRAEGLRTSVVRALHILAQMAEADGNPYRAVALERDAVKLVRGGAAPLDGVLSIHHLGVLLRDRGDTEEAELLLNDAAKRVRTRLESLTDDEFRAGYERQAAVQRILVDGAA